MLSPGPGSLRAVNGYLPVPRKPPAPDPALLDRYELVDPQRASWWRDRLRRVWAVQQAELQRAAIGQRPTPSR
jgi:O-succinylbenzoate synthase